MINPGSFLWSAKPVSTSCEITKQWCTGIYRKAFSIATWIRADTKTNTHTETEWYEQSLAHRLLSTRDETDWATITHRTINHLYYDGTVVLASRVDEPSWITNTKWLWLNWGQSQTQVTDNIDCSGDEPSHHPYIMCRMELMCQAALIEVIFLSNLCNVALRFDKLNYV